MEELKKPAPKKQMETKRPPRVEYTVWFVNGGRRDFIAEKGSIFGSRWIAIPAGNGYPETAYPIYTVSRVESRPI